MNWKEVAFGVILFVVGLAFSIWMKDQRRGNGYNGRNRKKY